MTVPAFLVTPDKNFQLFAGAGHLVGWLVLMPYLAAALLRLVRRMNEAMSGQPDPWQESFFSFGKIFFASMSFVGALLGAALLSVFFLAQSGLIKNPWE
jgi:hypothetical protein